MSKTETVLFSQKGENSRSVNLSLEADGALKVSLFDTGPSVKGFWGRGEDYEAWVDIKPNAVAHLAFLLLRDRFLGRENALDDIMDYCKQNAVDHKFMNWF